MEIISKSYLSLYREALYGFLGVSQTRSGEILIFDIGGGSTELVLGNNHIEHSVSLRLGCVRSSEDFIKDQDAVEQSEIDRLYDYAYKKIKKALDKFDLPENFDLIGVGGTITTLAMVVAGLDIYDSTKIHDSIVTLDEVNKLLECFIKTNCATRAEIIGIPKSRVDTIIAGTVIVKAIFEASGKQSCTVCDFDNMEGAAYYKFIKEKSSEWDNQKYIPPKAP